MSGPEICTRLRAEDATRTLPVIMLSSRGEESLRLRGFAVGADDFAIRPFSMRELIARVRALLRRSRFAVANRLLIRGDLQLDHETRRVRRGLRDVRVSRTGFRLLECLLGRPGNVFSRAHLLERVWGPSVDINDRAIDVYIGRLRKALSVGRERDPILTVPVPAIPSMKPLANPQHQQVRNRRGHPDPSIGNTTQLGGSVSRHAAAS